VARASQRIPTQIQSRQSSTSICDAIYDIHSSLGASQVLPAHLQRVQPFSNIGDSTPAFASDGCSSLLTDQVRLLAHYLSLKELVYVLADQPKP
jgi:hypothetical protein